MLNCTLIHTKFVYLEPAQGTIIRNTQYHNVSYFSEYFKMPRSRDNIKRQKPVPGSMVNAANVVLKEGVSVRQAAKTFGVDR